MVKLYNPYEESKEVITEFRKLFYGYLEKSLGKFGIENNTKNGGNVVFKLNNIPLFVVPAFYYGIGVWTPHISIVNTADVKTHNPNLYSNYLSKQNKSSKINSLLQPIFCGCFTPIGDIDMRDHIGSLTVTVSNKSSTVNV